LKKKHFLFFLRLSNVVEKNAFMIDPLNGIPAALPDEYLFDSDLRNQVTKKKRIRNLNSNQIYKFVLQKLYNRYNYILNQNPRILKAQRKYRKRNWGFLFFFLKKKNYYC